MWPPLRKKKLACPDVKNIYTDILYRTSSQTQLATKYIHQVLNNKPPTGKNIISAERGWGKCSRCTSDLKGSGIMAEALSSQVFRVLSWSASVH